MEVKFRQVTKNGCGSLSLANIFDDHRFCIRLEYLKGESINDLNLKMASMAQAGIEIFIDCLFLTQPQFKTGNRLSSNHSALFTLPKTGVTKKIREQYAVPYLLTIANRGGRNHHMIAAVYSISDGMFHIIDSTKPKVLVLAYSNMVKRFQIISVSVFRFLDNPEPGNFVMMPKSELSHIFQNS